MNRLYHDASGETGTLGIIGWIIIIISIILAIPTCLVSLVGVIIGAILIYLDSESSTRNRGYYPPQPPGYYGPAPAPTYLPPPPPPPPPPPTAYTMPANICPNCHQPLTFVQQYNKWYCSRCGNYM